MPDGIGEHLKLFLILISFFAILYGGYYFSTRIKTAGIKNLKSNGLKVIQGIYLGREQSLQLVKIYDKYVILGVTKDNISLIMEVSEEDICDDNLENKSDKFGNMLGRLVKLEGDKKAKDSSKDS